MYLFISSELFRSTSIGKFPPQIGNISPDTTPHRATAALIYVVNLKELKMFIVVEKLPYQNHILAPVTVPLFLYTVSIIHVIFPIPYRSILWSSGKDRQGMALKAKGLKA